ncbi:MAG: hypothetical protein U0670_23415 [Anaerolineae bacterium]
MTDKGKEFPKRLSVQITDAMDDRLEQVARERDEPKTRWCVLHCALSLTNRKT